MVDEGVWTRRGAEDGCEEGSADGEKGKWAKRVWGMWEEAAWMRRGGGIGQAV